MERIDILIKKDASIEYEVKGVKGKGCQELTKTIDEISGKVLESRKTNEYYEKEQKERLRNRS